MQNTKKTDTTNKTNKTSNTNVVKSNSNTTKFTKNNTSAHEETTFDMNDDKKKPVRKAGRTILVKSVSGNSINSSVFSALTGVTSLSETKTSSSYFLTFDNVTNAVNAFRKLRTDSTDYRVKFSYYRVFFTINGLTDTTDYNQVKQDMVNYVTDKTGTSVLYCKLYRKDNKYLGCGDFTIDTNEGMNALLSKEGGLKEFTIGQLTGTFYRYNGKKDKSEAQTSVDA